MYEWYSQPLVGKVPAGNLLLSADILFSRATYTRLSSIARLLKMSIFSERTFYRIQKSHVYPFLDAYYKHNQTVVAEILRDRGPLILSVDGCCDSPGYSAKYCTYSLMDNSTGLILDYSLVQVTETGISVAMEKEGLQRCLKYVLDELNLHIATLAMYVFK